MPPRTRSKNVKAESTGSDKVDGKPEPKKFDKNVKRPIEEASPKKNPSKKAKVEVKANRLDGVAKQATIEALPLIIWQNVLQYLSTEDQAEFALSSKYCYDFTTPLLYHEPKPTTTNLWTKLARTVKNNEQLAELVKRFDVDAAQNRIRSTSRSIPSYPAGVSWVTTIITYCTSLEHVTVNVKDSEVWWLEVLVQLTNLKSLTMNCHRNIGVIDFEPNARKIKRMKNFNFDEFNLDIMWPHLTSLTLNSFGEKELPLLLSKWAPNVRSAFLVVQELDDGCLKSLRENWPNLETLHIGSERLTSSGLLQNIHGLKSLGLEGCHNVLFSDLAKDPHFDKADLKHLDAFAMFETRIHGVDLFLSKCQLRVLELSVGYRYDKYFEGQLPIKDGEDEFDAQSRYEKQAKVKRQREMNYDITSAILKMDTSRLEAMVLDCRNSIRLLSLLDSCPALLELEIKNYRHPEIVDESRLTLKHAPYNQVQFLKIPLSGVSNKMLIKMRSCLPNIDRELCSELLDSMSKARARS